MTTSPPSSPPLRGNHLEQFARLTPDALAVWDSEHALSWAQWDEQANRLADALARRGIGRGDRLGVRMVNRIEWFVVDAALAKLGAVRVAVSFRLRTGEIQHILRDSNACGVFFDDEDPTSLAQACDGLDALRLRIGLFGGNPEQPTLAQLIAEGSPEPRYTEAPGGSVVYTSGTTGAPKGVERKEFASEERRKRVRALGDDLRRSIPYQRGDRNLLAAPLNHAAGPASALATHSRGGSVFLMRKFDPEEALRLIARHRITVTFMVPTMLNRIINLPPEVLARYDVSSMRVISTGASVCPSDLKRKAADYFGPCLYESYGSTETGLLTIFTPKDLAERADSCGRLLEGVDVRIVDEQGKPLPRGEVGQIYIKGPFTIDSYLGEQAPGADFTADGYFTAGDVGKLDADGYLYILDRKKDMVIVGGVNIYPAEVEAALRAHPAVLDAAVFGVPHPDLGEQVHAACELVPGREVEARELTAFAAERLATYKLPRAITFVEELPRNAAGKVLKRELRAPYWAGQGRVI